MSGLRFQLFGKFNAWRRGEELHAPDTGKDRELLSYLITHRDRPIARELIASLLWPETPTERSKKYLRQAIWHLTSAFSEEANSGHPLLHVEHDWVQLRLPGDSWVDVIIFDRALAMSQGVGQLLNEAQVKLLTEAVDIYVGDFLEGWYQDWCLFERERLQNAYLYMLDKLIDHASEHEEFEAGKMYAAKILSHDRASECTYRRLMRLLYRAGDRTGALRQYQRCVVALREELGVQPELRTRQLYEELRSEAPASEINEIGLESGLNYQTALPDILQRLRDLQSALKAMQNRIHKDIHAVERVLKTKTTK
jgi:DNA-binding SARP family transcriptional activator